MSLPMTEACGRGAARAKMAASFPELLSNRSSRPPPPAPSRLTNALTEWNQGWVVKVRAP